MVSCPTLRVTSSNETRYCRNYRVSQFVALDGQVALGIIFKAAENENGDFRSCTTRLVFASGNQAGYLIFRIVEQGISRLFGEAYGKTDLRLDGWERKHRYYDGVPYWRSGNAQRLDHPEGWTRYYSSADGVHIWAKAGRDSVSESLVPQARAAIQRLF